MIYDQHTRFAQECLEPLPLLLGQVRRLDGDGAVAVRLHEQKERAADCALDGLRSMSVVLSAVLRGSAAFAYTQRDGLLRGGLARARAAEWRAAARRERLQSLQAARERGKRRSERSLLVHDARLVLYQRGGEQAARGLSGPHDELRRAKDRAPCRLLVHRRTHGG